MNTTTDTKCHSCQHLIANHRIVHDHHDHGEYGLACLEEDCYQALAPHRVGAKTLTEKLFPDLSDKWWRDHDGGSLTNLAQALFRVEGVTHSPGSRRCEACDDGHPRYHHGCGGLLHHNPEPKPDPFARERELDEFLESDEWLDHEWVERCDKCGRDDTYLDDMW